MNGRLSERGSETLEFAVALPFLIILLYAIGAFAWAFWSQAVADVVAVGAMKEAGVNRGEGIAPGTGHSFFNNNMGELSNADTAGAVGPLSIQQAWPYRSITYGMESGMDLSLGDFFSVFSWGGGGLGRIWQFFGGPPDSWE